MHWVSGLCPNLSWGNEIGIDGKAEVINQDKLEECGGESVCPFGAIERIEGESKLEKFPQSRPQVQYPPSGGKSGPGRGRGVRRGWRRGKGWRN